MSKIKIENLSCFFCKENDIECEESYERTCRGKDVEDDVLVLCKYCQAEYVINKNNPKRVVNVYFKSLILNTKIVDLLF